MYVNAEILLGLITLMAGAIGLLGRALKGTAHANREVTTINLQLNNELKAMYEERRKVEAERVQLKREISALRRRVEDLEAENARKDTRIAELEAAFAAGGRHEAAQ